MRSNIVFRFLVLVVICSVMAPMGLAQKNRDKKKKIKESAVKKYNLAVELSSKEQWQEAAEVYRQAIRIKPENVEAYFNLGVTYGSLKRLTEAIETLNHVIALRPNYTEAHYMMGLIYVEMKDKDRAVATYNTLKGLDEKLAEKLLVQIPE